MSSDRFLGQEDEGVSAQAEKDKTPGAAGVTGVFSGLPEEPSKPGEGPARALPVVHSVVFKADSSRAEGTDQLLNILRSPAPKPETPPAAAPPSASPALSASSGGFTQLLRALNYDQVKGAAGNEPAKMEPSAISAPTPVAAPSPVTSFQTPPASAPAGSFTQLFQSTAPVQEARKVEAPSAVVGPGSFTQMFQTLDAAPAEPAKQEATSVPPAAASTTPTLQPAATPGSFTQMFRALDTSPVEEARVEPPPAPVTSAPGSFTAMFAAVSSPDAEPAKAEIVPAAAAPPEPAIVANPAPAPLPAPGSFTQMFRALDAAPIESKESEMVATAPAPNLLPQIVSTTVSPMQATPEETALPVAAPNASSFTQMFRALDAAPPEVARTEPAVTAAVGPGSFTQMFQAVSSPPVEPVKQEAPTGAPGAFTQMFSASPAPAVEPSRLESTAPASSGSFTQMFRTLDAAPPPVPPPERSGGEHPQMFNTRQPQESERAAPPFAPVEGVAPVVRPSTASANVSAGGLTQLLRTLDQPSQAPSRPYVPVAPPPAEGQQAGTFTSVYGTLGGEAHAPSALPPTSAPPQQQAFPPVAGRDATQAFRVPPSGAIPSAAAPAETGPSEFTRILNASMLRESALRGGGEAAVPPAPQAPPQGSAATPQWAMPVAPKLPEAPKLPQAPKAPEMKVPSAPKAGMPSGMQKYLPLLLILIVFLLLAILVAVVFLMKR